MSVASESERSVVLDQGELRGWPRAELDAAIAIESGWNPGALNPSSRAAGLIQFMPFILTGLGWKGTPEAFAKLTATEQAPFVGKYFARIGKPWKLPGDTYVAMAASGFVGAPDATVVYAKDSNAWKLNPSWRGADGEITAGSIRAVLLRKMAGRAAPPASSPKSSSRRLDGAAALGALLLASELL